MLAPFYALPPPGKSYYSDSQLHTLHALGHDNIVLRQKLYGRLGRYSGLRLGGCLNLPYSSEGGVADTGSAFAGMSRIPHKPEAFERCPSGKAKGTKGGDALTDTANNALLTSGKVGKRAGGCGFLVDDEFWLQVKVLIETCDRSLYILLL